MSPVVYLLLFSLSYSGVSSAITLKELEQQRSRFILAEKALQAGEIKTYKLHSFQLTDYPLYPYLQYDYLIYKIGSTSLQEIKTFENRYPDFPKNQLLREAWLSAQAGQGKWKSFLAEYTPTNKASLQCRAIYAKYLMDNDRQDLNKGMALWLVGHSQASVCDPLFDVMKKEGILENEAYWQRIELALHNRDFALANHLKKNLTPKDNLIIDTWIKVIDNPNLIQNKEIFKRFREKTGLIKVIVTQSLQLYAKNNPFGTMQLLELSVSKYALEASQVGAIQKAIALSLSVKRHDLAQQWLDKIPSNLLDKSTHELQIRNAIKQQNWKRLIYLTENLPQYLKKTKRWRFWRGYAWKQEGFHKEANTLFSELAPLRDYYGFLASAELNKHLTIHNVPKKVDTHLLNQVSLQPSMMRTRELIQLQRPRQSRSEWLYALSHFNENQRQAAARIAYQMKWYDLGILALSQAKNKDDLPIRFPLAYSETFMREAKRHKLEPAWLFAVSRQESAFTRDAYSSSGAIGLMQLMPATANYIAKKVSFPLGSTAELLQVDTNVRLGAAYLQYLSNKMGNNPVLITASYNAGPGRSGSWLPNKSVPAIQWIETIPVTETREYVKNVLTYIGIYRELLGEDGDIQDLMPPIKPVAT